MDVTLCKVREKFFETCSSDGNNVFNVKELDMIKTMDSFVIRVIVDIQKSLEDGSLKGDVVQLAVDRLINILKWREENKVYEITAKDLPREFYEFGHSKLGHAVGTNQLVHLMRPIQTRNCQVFNK